MANSLLASRYLEQFLNFLTVAPASLRLLVFFLIWIFLWIPVVIPLAVGLNWHPCRYPIPASQKLPLVASLYALAPVVIWTESILEKVPLTEYGVYWHIATLQSLGFGLVIGVLGLALLFAIQWRLGWLQVQFSRGAALPGTVDTEGASMPWNAARTAGMLFTTLGIALWISLIEELVFRGFLLNQLQRDYSFWIAVTIASLIFALLHLVWEGRETLLQLPGLWLMGVVLSIARWADHGNLGLAIGLHTGWVWTIASLDTMQLLHHTSKSPEWLTGFGNKPLAGVLGLLFLLGTAGVLMGLGIRG